MGSQIFWNAFGSNLYDQIYIIVFLEPIELKYEKTYSMDDTDVILQRDPWNPEVQKWGLVHPQQCSIPTKGLSASSIGQIKCTIYPYDGS